LDTGTRRNADEPRDAKDGDATKENQTDDDLESPDKTGG
jgi:hypothetical protein